MAKAKAKLVQEAPQGEGEGEAELVQEAPKGEVEAKLVQEAPKGEGGDAPRAKAETPPGRRRRRPQAKEWRRRNERDGGRVEDLPTSGHTGQPEALLFGGVPGWGTCVRATTSEWRRQPRACESRRRRRRPAVAKWAKWKWATANRAKF